MVPIWKKSRNEVSDEDYDNFYMEKFNDYDKPLKMISTSVEGKISYKGLKWFAWLKRLKCHSTITINPLKPF